MSDEMKGTVAIWVPDGVITRDEMLTARPAFEAAIAQHKDTIVIHFDEDRPDVTCRRVIVVLPIFIESASAEQANALANVLSERADRSRAN